MNSDLQEDDINPLFQIFKDTYQNTLSYEILLHWTKLINVFEWVYKSKSPSLEK